MKISSREKDVSFSEKDVSFSKKDVSFAEKDVSFAEKNVSFSEKNISFSKKSVSFSKMDASLSEKDVSFSKKKVFISETELFRTRGRFPGSRSSSGRTVDGGARRGAHAFRLSPRSRRLALCDSIARGRRYSPLIASPEEFLDHRDVTTTMVDKHVSPFEIC
jgi:hypothetical protein